MEVHRPYRREHDGEIRTMAEGPYWRDPHHEGGNLTTKREGPSPRGMNPDHGGETRSTRNLDQDCGEESWCRIAVATDDNKSFFTGPHS
ncbi:hypothetical protein RRG08_020630 [Elysia crispata]|uniref:Uncharacterized protein n=1 Tax=Elysia crispata TaxID=231223 RepID=A0AAE1ABL5_9GAST|nr:hypothetical protein RRG08_020630 [Elysia crispata]